MKLSEVAMEVEEWLDRFTYGYEFNYVDVKSESEYVFHYWEFPRDKEDFFTVEDGVIINSNGDDVTEVAQEAYSNDEEMIEWVRRFVEKWYKKGE